MTLERSSAMQLKVSEVMISTLAINAYWSLDGTEAVVIAGDDLYKVYETHGHIFVIATTLDMHGWEEVE